MILLYSAVEYSKGFDEAAVRLMSDAEEKADRG